MDILRCASVSLTSEYVEYRIRAERGNLPYLSQRDPPRNHFAEEVLDNPPLRNRRSQAPRARARAPASPSRASRGAVRADRSQRRLRLARHSLQCEEHVVATTSSWLVGSRMRSLDWCIGAIGLQLGGGQG